MFGITLLNAFVLTFIGFYVGKLMAMTTHYLPQILLEGCDQGREPSDIFKWFFDKNHTFDALLFQVGIGLLFGVSALIFPLNIQLVFVLGVSCLLICCFLTDYHYGILPDQLTLTLVWIGLIASLFPVFISPSEAILGAAMGYGIFWAFNAVYRFFRGQEGMYPGDFKLNAGIGALVGIKTLIPIIIISSVLMIVITLFQHIFLKKSFLSREVPYACFVSLVVIFNIYALLT